MKYGLLFCFVFSFSLSINGFTQEQKAENSKINITADFVSRYIWRGLDYGKAPSIQPTFSFIKSNFEIGTWGAFNTL
jgi:hypothetical protein